jgi:hypothetical protein
VVAAPGAVVVDFSLPLRRKLLEEAAVVHQAGVLIALHQAQGVSQRHFAVPVMVAVAFAVGGYVDKLWLVVVQKALLEAGHEAFA